MVLDEEVSVLVGEVSVLVGEASVLVWVSVVGGAMEDKIYIAGKEW